MGATTTGVALDQNGYVLEVVGTPALRPIQSDDILTVPDVPAGDAELRLSGIRGNCRVHGEYPRRLRVPAADTVETRFYIICDSLRLRGRIAFTDDRGTAPELYSMNPDGGDQRRLTETQEAEAGSAISPDGTRVLYIRFGRAVSGESVTEMVTMDPVGRVVKLFDGGEHPAWSPDGGRVVFQEAAGDLGANDIFVIDADGTGVRNLTNTEADIEVEPVWSPDGSRIVFTTGDLAHLEIMNADGTGRRVLLESHSGAASWSPDGSRIAFLAPTEFGLDFGLFTMRPDGTGLTQLTPGAMTADGPASWSPAGDRLAFTSSVNGFEDVFVIGADGTGLTNISNTPRVDEYLGPQAWGR